MFPLNLLRISVNTLLMILGSPPSIANFKASSNYFASKRKGIFLTIDFSCLIKKLARAFLPLLSAILANLVKSMLSLMLGGSCLDIILAISD